MEYFAIVVGSVGIYGDIEVACVFSDLASIAACKLLIFQHDRSGH
jgi:hypothetical protein